MSYTEVVTEPTEEYSINCTGDAVTGDHVRWTEAVFSGSHRKPKFAGTRTIEARIVNDSYGSEKQQHTFTLEVTAAEGVDAPPLGKKIRRKGRNLYRNDTYRRKWDNEAFRQECLDEKHGRGDKARAAREERRAVEDEWHNVTWMT